MDDQDYEEIVSAILRELANTGSLSPGGSETIVTRDRTLPGKSGHHHQIDIVVEFKHFNVRFLTLVECKHWNKPVGVAEVMVLSHRIHDIGAHKGILVSSSGFQKGAFRVAESNAIALVLCRRRSEFRPLLERTNNGDDVAEHKDLISAEEDSVFSFHVSLLDRHLEPTTLGTLISRG